MFKKSVGIFLGAAMSLSLAACGSSATTATTAAATEGSAAATEAASSDSSAKDASSTDFPTKTMTIVCPYGAGGGTDLALRILAECGQDVFGQTINVENKTGGSGTVGLTEALNAAPDGYTLGTASVDLITLPLLGLAPEEVTRDAFDPICVINGEPAAIIVKKDAKWDTLEDFINDAKENPGSIQIANAGMGNIWHLAMIGVELKTDAKFTHVPFSDGTSQALAAVLGGHVNAIACSPAEADSNIQNGDLKILGVAADERMERYPDVPTFKESGIDLTIMALRGLCVNKNVPDDVKQVLKDGFKETINSDKCKEKVEAANMTYLPLDADETNKMLDDMSGNFEDIIDAYLKSAQ